MFEKAIIISRFANAAPQILFLKAHYIFSVLICFLHFMWYRSCFVLTEDCYRKVPGTPLHTTLAQKRGGVGACPEIHGICDGKR